MHARMVCACNVKRIRRCACVDENALGAEGLLALCAAQDNGVLVLKLGLGVDHLHVCHVVQFGEIGGAQLGD